MSLKKFIVFNSIKLLKFARKFFFTNRTTVKKKKLKNDWPYGKSSKLPAVFEIKESRFSIEFL